MRTRSLAGIRAVEEDLAELVLDVVVFGLVFLPMKLLEGGLVPLVHEEELALGQHLADDLVEQLAPSLEGDGFVADAVEGALAEVVDAHVEGHQDVVLRLEVVVERRLGHPQPFGDLPQEAPSKPCAVKRSRATSRMRSLVEAASCCPGLALSRWPG